MNDKPMKDAVEMTLVVTSKIYPYDDLLFFILVLHIFARMIRHKSCIKTAHFTWSTPNLLSGKESKFLE